MVDDVKSKLEIEVPEDNEENPQETTVNLEKPAKAEVPVDYVSKMEFEKVQKQLNGLSYATRKMDELARKIDSIQVNRQEVPIKPKVNSNKYDELVQEDWQQAVRGLSREEIRQIIAEEKAEQSRIQREQSIDYQLNSAKQKVREKYPEIDDVESEVGKRYLEVMNDRQDYLTNPYGPMLTMYEMEERMRKDGVLDDHIKPYVDKEVNRRQRVTATALTKGSVGARGSNKVVLTKDQIEFCNHNEIPYEEYAKNIAKQAKSGRNGVEA